jgi:hypothetical protein
MEEFLRSLGITKTRKIPLHSQSDGMVEFYVKMVEKQLIKVVTTHERDWDDRLCIFFLAYCS